MKIEFEYLNREKCNLDDANYSHWGCCCQCASKFWVAKHCTASPREDKCVCGDSLGFHICLALGMEDESRRANLSGEHGVCEMFRDMNKKEG